MMMRQLLALLIGLLVLLPVYAGTASAMVSAETIRRQLAQDTDDTGNQSAQVRLKHFYAQRDYQPAWIISNQYQPILDTALSFIARADEEGLDISNYSSAHLQQLHASPEGETGLALELGVTRSLLALAQDLYSGQLSATAADPDWHIPQQKFDSVTFLQQALTQNNLQQAFADLAPSMPQYNALRRLLMKLRQLAAAGTHWTQIPEIASAIRPNSTHPAIPLIRQRILEAHAAYTKAEYALTTAESEWYDHELEAAIKTFQQQHGLNPDGIIGRHTRRALNTPLEKQIQKLRINMERLRWLPRNFGDRYVLVNIAGFYLTAIEHHTPVLDMRIVVGRDYRSTPSFNSRVSHLVLNPYWNIPNSIARQDLWPKQKKNPDYFASQGIRVFSSYRYEFELDPDGIDWHAVERRFPYALQQAPGNLNALGNIKFMFPNPFSIYLHDTPSKSLFQKDIRTYSSGCIRLEKPFQLAEFLLGRSLEDANITQQVDSGKTRTVHLPKRVPIYLVYITAWSDEQGDVRFSSDIYGRDKRALAHARWPEPAQLSQSY
ncbi:Murein L,D-transpeptidase YcbB/YkuD [Nitrosomonas halophila]|uniref:Murein L,D-transpeptidase YcbB/YkuD n=2 Tax=Nitrosomonas halophila TaxID=44576 RepID=A0A1H3C192_9PROT|nr:Murein L,D-transpeptidase YcbB/YkuD [Nitrosomonas halophila]